MNTVTCYAAKFTIQVRFPSTVHSNFTYYHYYYICLTAFFQYNLGSWVVLDFTGARDDGVAVASAGPYANHLQFAPDR